MANQNRQEAKGILDNIFRTIYNRISSEQHEESQSNEPPKTNIEASAFLLYESNLVVYDMNEKGYGGLIHIELATPYLQQHVNRHGNVRTMVRFNCRVMN